MICLAAFVLVGSSWSAHTRTERNGGLARRPSDYRSALAWADRLYAGAKTFARGGPHGFWLEEALAAYRQVGNVYGERSELRRRKSACLIAMGDYASGVIEAPASSPERQRAMQRRRISLATAKIVGRPALQVEPVPGTKNEFAVLSGKRIRNPEPPPDWVPPRIQNLKLWLVQATGNVRVLSAQSFPEKDDDELPVRWVDLVCSRLTMGGPAAVSVHLDYPAADSDPSEDDLYRVDGHRLTRIARFYSLYGTEIRPPTSRYALTLINAPAWKVAWPDAYTWTGRGFRLSNSQHPELYSISECLTQIAREKSYAAGYGEYEPSRLYVDYDRLGATLDVHRQFKRALAAWRRAETLCRRAAREDSGGGFRGDPKINLLEIRQRIRWLKRREYGHWLLYRPHDWDLQIPPYTLAKGHPSAGGD